MDHSAQIDFLEANLSRQISFIAAADSKVSFVLAVNTAMLGLLAAVVPRALRDWELVPGLLSVASALLAIASLIFLSLASFPRTTGPKTSLLFFGGITARSADQYMAAVHEASWETYLDDLCFQCYRNAEIAKAKHSWVQHAMVALYLSIPPWCTALFMLCAKSN